MAHWTERARLAFAPNFATLLIICFLPAVMAVVGGSIGAGALSTRLGEGMTGFWVVGLAALLLMIASTLSIGAITRLALE